ncbi:unnamed protein product [Rotaria sp. Silwood2]|nr:unnamed protein product [Rotaria sp. Silwood2]
MVYIIFCLYTNILVTSMLLTGGSAVVHSLSGIYIAAACFLLPLGTIIYTMFGRIKATFLTDYAHTVAVLIIILYFAFTTLATSPLFGSPSTVYDLLVNASRIHPVEGNAGGSYITMRSQEGAMFFIINIIGNFGTVFLDNGYFNMTITASYVSALPGYILGGISWSTVSFLAATTMGLAAVALESNPAFPSYPNRLDPADVSVGLILSAASVALLGKAGATTTLIRVFMVVTSAMSAQLIAVSSIITYDIYKTYFNKEASGKRLIYISHVSVVIFDLIMSAWSTGLYYLNISMSYLYLLMGVIISSAIIPGALTLIWNRHSKWAACLSSPLGLSCSLTAWLVTIKAKYGAITVETSESNIPNAYRVIQYAKVVRWKPPIDLANEIFPNASYQATSFGPCCPQPKTDTYIPEQDEQCLYLNIYKPIVQSIDSLLPVFVWIHGGAHKIGCSSQSIPLIYNGTNMIAHSPPDQPVIIITINYRLGVLADMFLKELIEEDPEWPTAGNYMYLDMLSALRWINKNIRDYGGDPSNVSLFGQSAGGLSVIDLGAVKGSAGLYRTVISQSGLDSPGTYSSYYNITAALNCSNSIVHRLNCTNGDKRKVLSCIRNSSNENLFLIYGDRYTRPIIDNYFFPLYPPLAIQNGQYNNISLIMGNNDYDLTVCLDHPDMNYTDAIELISQSIEHKWIPAIVDYYHLKNCSANRTSNNTRCCNIVLWIATDKFFDCDIRRLFNAFYLKYGPQYEQNKLFSYHLNCYPQCPTVPEMGICRHSAELPFVFGTISDFHSEELFNCTWDNSTRAFSNEIISHWINIATTGRPLNQWPSYDPSSPRHFHITPDRGFIDEKWHRNCSFYDEMEVERVKEIFGNNHYIVKEPSK